MDLFKIEKAIATIEKAIAIFKHVVCMHLCMYVGIKNPTSCKNRWIYSNMKIQLPPFYAVFKHIVCMHLCMYVDMYFICH